MLLDKGLCVEPDCTMFLVEPGTETNPTATSSTEAKSDEADDPAKKAGQPDEAKPSCSGDDDDKRAEEATAEGAMAEDQKDGDNIN